MLIPYYFRKGALGESGEPQRSSGEARAGCGGELSLAKSFSCEKWLETFSIPYLAGRLGTGWAIDQGNQGILELGFLTKSSFRIRLGVCTTLSPALTVASVE
jgi:hypothetical protein